VSDLAVLFLAIAAVGVLLAVTLFAIYRWAERNEAPYYDGPDPDPRWGTDTALHDQCALIWDLPAHDPELEAGCDRLWAAIRDEQQNNKGDQP